MFLVFLANYRVVSITSGRSTALHFIVHIILWSPLKQMVRSYTRRVVAMVKNQEGVIDKAICQLVRHSMRSSLLAVPIKSTVPTVRYATRPLPAFTFRALTRRLINSCPKNLTRIFTGLSAADRAIFAIWSSGRPERKQITADFTLPINFFKRFSHECIVPCGGMAQ